MNSLMTIGPYKEKYIRMYSLTRTAALHNHNGKKVGAVTVKIFNRLTDPSWTRWELKTGEHGYTKGGTDASLDTAIAAALAAYETRQTSAIECKLQVRILRQIGQERRRQDAKSGAQDLPDGTGLVYQKIDADGARANCEEALAGGLVTWQHILAKEVAKVLAESDRSKNRAELIQTAAVCVAWIEAIDRSVVTGGDDE